MVEIAGRKINSESPPFIVAELSSNHQQSLKTALELVEAAKDSGVDAIKLQTFKPETMTLDIKTPPFKIEDPNSLWYGRTLFDLYEEAYLPWEWHEPIFQKCRDLDLIPFSTPFDKTSLEFLEDIASPCYKVASLEITDLPLIALIASKKKPIIFSTGASSLDEIEIAVRCARDNGCNEIILLKCTSAYPTRPEDANLRTMVDLASQFDCPVGISDHILENGASIASIALGGCWIEKHFTLSRADGGLDAAFSLEPYEMRQLVREAHVAWKSLGEIHYGHLKSEATSYSHRRSVYFIRDLNEGDVITEEDVAVLRPLGGLEPKFLPKIVGAQMKASVKRGQPTSVELINIT